MSAKELGVESVPRHQESLRLEHAPVWEYGWPASNLGRNLQKQP